jgi:microcystin-dependent protein
MEALMSNSSPAIPSAHPARPRATAAACSATRRPLRRAALAAALLAGAAVAPSVQAQAEPFIGQLMLVPYNFCPYRWAEASGQLLSIVQNTALFSLIGTYYGGNGQTTFALPDLRGRVPVHVGQGPGLSSIALGEAGGTESVTLLSSNLPAHSHALNATAQPATHAAPATDRALAATQNAGTYTAGPPNTSLVPGSVGLTGNNVPFSVRNPYLGMRWCIALQGIYPSRN